MLDKFIEAPIIVAGTLQNAVAPNNALPNGQTELVVGEIVLSHPLLKGRKVVMIDRYLPDAKGPMLVAIDVQKGMLDPYSSVELDKEGAILMYVKGALQLKDKSHAGRMRYSFDYLTSPNAEVANSALIEVERGTYSDYRKLAEKLDPAPIFKAFQKADPQSGRLGVYAKLLGHCGKSEHSVALRKSLEVNGPLVGRHDVMLGFALLDPTNGWSYVSNIASNAKQPFLTRYSALQAMRFIAADRRDVVDAKKAFAGIAEVLRVPDMADFAIEDLRRHQRWEYCEAVLEISGKAGYTTPIISRSILRYTLECPSPLAKTHVLIERNRDPEWVAETKELLDLEIRTP